MSIFASNLRFLRNQLGRVSQKDIAIKLQVNPKTYAAWEEGRGEPRNDMMIKISNIYEVSISSLIREDLTKSTVEQTKENFIISRYNVAPQHIQSAIDNLLRVVK